MQPPVESRHVIGATLCLFIASAMTVPLEGDVVPSASHAATKPGTTQFMSIRIGGAS